MYANLTQAQRDEIIKQFRGAKEIAGYDDPLHFTAIAAHNVLSKTTRALNGKKGSNAFAAALATLVMAKEISVS